MVEYELEFKKTKMLELLGYDIDKKEDVQKFWEKLDSKDVKKEITNDGDVIFVANELVNKST